MNKPYDVNDYPLYKQMYDRYEPYHYFDVYLAAHKAMKNDPIAMFAMKPEEFLAQRNFTRLADVAFNLKECKIIQVDPDLLPLLEDTDADFEELKMPYPAMFVNHQFEIGRFRINGFLLIDIEALQKEGFEIEKKWGQSSIRILSVTLNTKGKYEFYSIEPLEEWNKAIDERKHFSDTLQENKEMVKTAKLINKLGANLINTIINNQKEIDTTFINYTDEQNAKRIKRGKHIHRNKLVLRLTGKLKQYASHYSKARGEISVRFIVRGHWRRYKSDRYKELKGTKKWIYPFYKGEEKAEELYHKIVELR